jgi:hypothetical protein
MMDMSMTTISLNEALDQAVASLGPIRRRVNEKRLKNPKYRDAVLDELAMRLSEDKDCPCQAIMAADGFSATTRFELDLDNLEKFLQIIIKYLPTILELVLKFLPLFMSLLLAAVFSVSTAQAQCYIDPFTGQQVCMNKPAPRPVVAVAQAVLSPYPAIQAARVDRAQDRAIAKSYGRSSGGSSGTASYGSSGSSVSYGSNGSTSGGSSGGSASRQYTAYVPYGYSVSSTVSYGSSGSVVSSNGSNGGSTGCPTIPVPQSLPKWN